MPFDPYIEDVTNKEQLKTRLSDLIRFVNDLERRIQSVESLLGTAPNDYLAERMLGTKTYEGKMVPYTVDDLVAWVDAIDPDIL